MKKDLHPRNCLFKICFSIAALIVDCMIATSALAALTVADLPAAGGVLQDKTIYMVRKKSTLTGDNGSALVVASNAEVVIYIPAGVSLTCRGSDAKSYLAPGHPGILLPKGSSLYVTGAGYLTASGGSAGNGGDGGSGQGAFLSGSGSNSTKTMYGGIGGVGGMGGSGAGAGIGSSGGKGGSRGLSGNQVYGVCGSVSDGYTYGKRGEKGGDGANSADVGDIYILGSVNASSYGGNAGTAGAGGGKQDKGSCVYFNVSSGGNKYVTAGDGGGGGGGGGGFAGSSIGAGGAGAGGGGAGGGGSLYSWVTKELNPQRYFPNGGGGYGGRGSKIGGDGLESAYDNGGVSGGSGGACGTQGNSGKVYISGTATLANIATLVAENTSPQWVGNDQPLLKSLIVFTSNSNLDNYASTNVMYFGVSNIDDINVPKPDGIVGVEFKGFYTDTSSSGQQAFDENGVANLNVLKALGFADADGSWIHAQDVTFFAKWKQMFDIDVPTGMTTNITHVIGAEYGDFNKRGGGDLTLSAANEFTGSITNCGGLIIADIGVGIPQTACLVFKSGTYAPRTARTLTVPLGTGPGEFDMTLDHLKIAALNAPLTINFGGNAEPIISGGPMNPNAKAFHFGWKDNNNEYPITILNPLVLSSPLTLRSQRNAPVTLAGGVCAASGVTGKSLDMPDGWPSQFRFTETGPLNIPENNWNPQGGGTTIFDGGSHEVGDVYGSRHNIVFTNGAHFVSKVCYFGRDNSDYTFNVHAYNSVISNASGFVRLGCTSGAKGNWYMRAVNLRLQPCRERSRRLLPSATRDMARSIRNWAT